jgi:hypothetical protein
MQGLLEDADQATSSQSNFLAELKEWFGDVAGSGSEVQMMTQTTEAQAEEAVVSGGGGWGVKLSKSSLKPIGASDIALNAARSVQALLRGAESMTTEHVRATEKTADSLSDVFGSVKIFFADIKSVSCRQRKTTVFCKATTACAIFYGFLLTAVALVWVGREEADAAKETAGRYKAAMDAAAAKASSHGNFDERGALDALEMIEKVRVITDPMGVPNSYCCVV